MGFSLRRRRTIRWLPVNPGTRLSPVCALLVINLTVAVLMQLNKGKGWLSASHAIEDAICKPHASSGAGRF